MNTHPLRHTVLALAILGTLAACKPNASAPATDANTPAKAAAPAAAPAGGIDLAGIDKSVKPGDDFDNYANGTWAKTAEIPADRSATGSFLDVFNKAEQREKELVQGIAASKPAAGSDEARIANAYNAFMDTAGIEQRGLAPLKPELDSIDGIKDKAALAQYLGAGMRADVDPLNATNYHTDHLFGLFVSQGLTDPSKNVAYLLQGGLGLPDRDYYLSNDKAMVEIRGKYETYIGALLKQAGIADPDAKAKQIMALETQIAKAHAPLTDSDNVHKANNLWATADFAKKAPGLDWSAYFKAAGLDGQPAIDAWHPQAVTKLAALVGSQPIDAWKAWLAFHAIDDNTAFLPKAFDDLGFAFHGTALNGIPQQRERWKRALTMTDGLLGDAIGKRYVEKYFPASSREQITQLVNNLLAVFPERIDKLDWMSPETKAKAKAKVAAIKVGVGYPDTWRDYSQLEIKADDPLGNAERAGLAEYQHQIAKLGKAPDRGEWWMTPQTVNAVNLPLQNALNFPAAILEAPFFDPKADAAVNYGSIGATIGHEISHSFDNLGADFDAEGRMANWWTPADSAHFKASGQKLAAQYDTYEALPGLHVKGEQTLGENIADLAGLAVAYDAYHKSLNGKDAPVIDGMTGDQRFFLAFAQSWRTKMRDATLRNRIATDVHAPARFRIMTVRNIDGWYAPFNVVAGQKMYLDPKDRVRIW
ncbi:M13 family metallopeptidase [Solilutibacter silvestris]|uniref:Putative metalloendopeptidase n=1 Tax=Solilutibacter silvestris TaxID=1645665 RepID=A0A2K1Q0Q7_9GAMM|nr:M13 family metallopeptidase [Lysobacter silvestris]PNS08621.1 putative metalloendopeptidase [Lysobacter silvestris]